MLVIVLVVDLSLAKGACDTRAAGHTNQSGEVLDIDPVALGAREDARQEEGQMPRYNDPHERGKNHGKAYIDLGQGHEPTENDVASETGEAPEQEEGRENDREGNLADAEEVEGLPESALGGQLLGVKMKV